MVNFLAVNISERDFAGITFPVCSYPYEAGNETSTSSSINRQDLQYHDHHCEPHVMASASHLSTWLYKRLKMISKNQGYQQIWSGFPIIGKMYSLVINPSHLSSHTG